MITTIKKLLRLSITQGGASNLYSFLGGNGRGVEKKKAGNQEGVNFRAFKRGIP